MKKKNKTFKAYEKILRNDHDWDYMYLLRLEKKKLTRMFNCFSNSSQDTKESRDISLCLRLIDIILEEDPVSRKFYQSVVQSDENTTLHFPAYVNYQNENRFFNGGTRPIKEYIERNSRKPVFQLDELRKTKAMFLYNKIRAYKMFSWWV